MQARQVPGAALCFSYLLLATLGGRWLIAAEPGGGADSWAFTLAEELLLCTALTALILLLRSSLMTLAIPAVLIAYAALAMVNVELVYSQGHALGQKDLTAGWDWVFISNSLRGLVFPLYALFLWLGAGIVALLLMRSEFGSAKNRPLQAGVSLSAAITLLLLHSNGLGQSLNAASIISLVGAGTDTNTTADQPYANNNRARVQHFNNVGGASLISAQARTSNVILLVLEGIGGDYLGSNAEHYDIRQEVVMPNLDSIASGGLIARDFIIHTSRTIRGLYALLCADYSKLEYGVFKAEEYLALPTDIRPLCLPQFLRDAGYQTTYMQAAVLSYMGKDRFMPAVGFDSVMGKANFPNSYVDNPWGPDDRAFLEQALVSLKSLHAGDKPFFATLLTVGTHHPFVVPDGFEAPYEHPRLVARAYLDEALGAFWQGLQDAGILEDTLVLITSDETRGIEGHPIAGFWGPLIAVGPGISPQITTDIRGQVDIAASIEDYLTAGTSDVLPGQSLFRHYREPRDVLFAGFLNQYALLDGQILHCHRAQDCGSRPIPAQGLFARTTADDNSAADHTEVSATIKQLLRQSDQALRFQRPEISVPAGKYTVKANEPLALLEARYLPVSSNDEICVSIAFNYDGDAPIEVKHSFIDPVDKRSLNGPTLEAKVKPGERYTLDYSFTPATGSDFAHPSLRVFPRQSSGSIWLEYATVINRSLSTANASDSACGVQNPGSVEP